MLVDLLEDVGGSAWLSYTCRDDGHTAAGEPIEVAVALGDAPGVVAVGVNCTAPRHVPALLARAATVTDQPLIAYPNRGDRWDAVAHSWVAEAAETRMTRPRSPAGPRSAPAGSAAAAGPGRTTSRRSPRPSKRRST